MTGFKHILVGIDFTRASEEALATALRLARRDGARLTALHASRSLDPLHGYSLPWETSSGLSDPHRLIALLEAELQNLVREFSTQDLDLEHLVTIGEPAERVAQVAVERGCDLIVVASHGKGPVERALIGSTAEAIVRRAEVPVWITRPGFDRHASRVIVGVDLASPSAEASLAFAAEQARRDGASLDVVHVTRDPGDERLFTLASDEDQRHYRDLLAADAREKFDLLRQHLALEGLDPDTLETHLLQGKPDQALRAHAELTHADLIVVGRHSHGPLHAFFIGSTAERLLRQGTCGAVVVVP